jgi:phthiodiolone/phenolphthiodiolone dimycocerosates ketoreductase
MIESIRIMHALWDSGGEPVSLDGEFWTLKDAVLPLQLYNGCKPRTLVVGGGPKLTNLAGELCDGWLTYLPGGIENDIQILKDMISAIKRIAAANGRDPEALEFGAMAMVCLAETDEAAWQLARSPGVAWLGIAAGAIDTAKAWEKWGHEHPLGKDYVWSQTGDRTGWQTAEAARALAPAVPDEVTDNTVIWGGPAKVADRLRQFIDAGLTQMSFMNCGPWGDIRSGLVWSECISEVITRLGHKPLNLTVPS